MKNIILCFPFIFIFISCSSGQNCLVGENKKDNCEALKTFTLAGFSQPLAFDHHCSKENLSSGHWQAYALFENQGDADQKALAVGQVKIGWVSGIQKIQGLRLSLEKIKMQSFSSWTGHNLSLAFQAVNLQRNESVTGEFVEKFFHIKRRTSRQEHFQVSPHGDLEWEQFIEPEEKTEENKGESKMLEIPQIPADNINFPEEEHSLHLLIKNQGTEEILTLQGPVLKNLDEILKVEYPESGVLGFFDVLNPFQKGGLWDVLQTGFRYRDCIYLRKQSKYELNKKLAY